MKALELLRCNMDKLNLPKELEILPSTMRIFLKYFRTGQEEEIYQFTDYELSKNQKQKIRWENSAKKNPWLMEGDRLLKLFTIEEILKEIIDYGKGMEEWHRNGKIQIGYTHGDAILLELDKEGEGGIYLYGDSTPFEEQDFAKIADNIFDLLFKIELIPNELALKDYKLNSRNLIRAFGTDYWQIR